LLHQKNIFQIYKYYNIYVYAEQRLKKTVFATVLKYIYLMLMYFYQKTPKKYISATRILAILGIITDKFY